MKRVYEDIIKTHFSTGNEALFLSGPRQVGKTTVSQNIQQDFSQSYYLNWDDREDRDLILSHRVPFINTPYLEKPLLIFDEIHKYKEWKSFLKGLIDKNKDHLNFLVTGSSRLNIFRKGGDSLMGRYFLYRIHPLTLGEILRQTASEKEISPPQESDEASFEALLRFGGFPRPFLAAETRIYNRWVNQRLERLMEEDIRETTQIHELTKMQILAQVLIENASQQLSYTSLGKSLQVSDQTIRRWIKTLEEFYYCFTIPPWHKNVTRSLLKNPKIFLYDWSLIKDKGRKYENFVASHLLKAVHFWTDQGFGQFGLYYLRDKDQREVDFLVTKNGDPWIMVEVKSSFKEPLSSSLLYFQKQLNAAHVFQVALEAPYQNQDCFEKRSPLIVPAKTFLSQLV